MARCLFGTATDLLCHILRPDPAAGAVSQHDSTDHGYQQNEPSCFEKKNVPGIKKVTNRLNIGFIRRERRNAVPQFDSRSEEHTSELQSLMRISYAVFCLKKKKQNHPQHRIHDTLHTTDTT